MKGYDDDDETSQDIYNDLVLMMILMIQMKQKR